MVERIRHWPQQVARLRTAETNPTNFRLSVSGFLADIDRMQREVRAYLSLHPTGLDSGPLTTALA